MIFRANLIQKINIGVEIEFTICKIDFGAIFASIVYKRTLFRVQWHIWCHIFSDGLRINEVDYFLYANFTKISSEYMGKVTLSSVGKSKLKKLLIQRNSVLKILSLN